jgi:hypothetical protein
MRRSAHLIFQMRSQPCAPPASTLLRVGVSFFHNRILCTGQSTTVPEDLPPTSSFHDFLCYKGEAPWCVNLLIGLEKVQEIPTAIKEGTVIAISDGSYQESFTTAAWILEGACESH